MQAITTKFLGPTNTRGSRIKATCDAGSITMSYDHALHSTAMHTRAAMALVRHLDWHTAGNWTCGELGNAYVFVCIGSSDEISPLFE